MPDPVELQTSDLALPESRLYRKGGPAVVPEMMMMPGGLDNALPKIADQAGYDALQAGAEYLDPEGQKRRKAYTVTDAKSYEAVPEGSHYTDPEGKVRLKPTYEGVDLTTQTLYDMSLNPKERRKALAAGYGAANVKEDPAGDLYVEKDGKRYKPGHGKLATLGGFVASEAAPTAGAVLGGIGGGVLGTAGGPAGVIAGAAGGAGAGGAGGQAFNDLVLKLAGIYDRSVGQEAGNLAVTAAGSAVGEGAGRVVTAAIPSVKAGIRRVTEQGPSVIADYLGASQTPDAAREALRLAERGVKVPPSAWAPEAPYIHKAVEQFDPAFRKQNVLKTSAEQYYEREGSRILSELGVERPAGETLTGATAPPSSEKAGRALMDRAHETIAQEDAELDKAMSHAREAATMRAFGIGQKEAQADLTAAHDQLVKVADSSRQAAQQITDDGFKAIRADVDGFVQAVKGGGNPGDLFRQAAEKVQTLSRAVKARAGKMYDAADAAAGDHYPNISALTEDAKALRESLPEPFQAKHPDIVKALEALGDPDKTGTQPTFGQLRRLRSMFRQDVDPFDLTPSQRDGVYKLFAGKLDAVLHDAEADPELKAAAKILDHADAYYAKNMPRFRDETIRGMTEALRAGMPADPKGLAKMILQPNQTERIREIRKIVGKNLWNAVTAADTQSMFDSAKTLVPGQVDPATFAREVLDRVQSGIFDAAYDSATARKLQQQAQRVMMIEGKLSIAHTPGDDVASFLKRAEDAEAAVKTLAERDPLGNLTSELSKMDKEFARNRAALQQSRNRDALNFLTQPTALAIRSADKILKSPDLMMAAARRFGETSPEFTLLRQTGALRLLQRPLGKTGNLAAEFGEKISPETQALLFPGVSRDEAVALAKDMNFLLGSAGEVSGDTGGSMAAASRVLHPWGTLGTSGPISFLSHLPGGNAAGRFILAKYYAALTYGVTHPSFIKWVVKGLDGAPAERETVRQEFNRILQESGGAGGGVGQVLTPSYSAGGDQEQGEQKPPAEDWRTRSKQQYGR